MTREEILGIPEEIQAGVDVDLIAATRGPNALDRALLRVKPAELEQRYRAALGRLAIQSTSRRSSRRAWEDFDLHEAAEERRQISRGGNR